MSETNPTALHKAVAGVTAAAALLGTMGTGALTAVADTGTNTGDTSVTEPVPASEWSLAIGSQTLNLTKGADNKPLSPEASYQGLPPQNIRLVHHTADGDVTGNATRGDIPDIYHDGVITYTLDTSDQYNLGFDVKDPMTFDVKYVAPEVFYLKGDDGAKIPLIYNDVTKTWSNTDEAGKLSVTEKPAATYNVYSYKHEDTPIALKRASITANASKGITETDVMGVYHVQGSADYEGENDEGKFQITMAADYTDGTPIKAMDANGKYTIQFNHVPDTTVYAPAEAIQSPLGDGTGDVKLNAPTMQELALSNGTSTKITWQNVTSSQKGADYIFQRTATAGGKFTTAPQLPDVDNAKDFGIDYEYSADLIASRTEAKWGVTLGGKTTQLTADKDGNLSASVESRWSNAKKTINVATGDKTETATLKLGDKTINDNGQQVATYTGATQDGRTITVNVTVGKYAWTAEVNGKQITFDYKGGAWAAAVPDADSKAPVKQLEATDGETTVTLDYEKYDGQAVSTDKFGVISVKGTASYKDKDSKFTLTLPSAYKVGQQVRYNQSDNQSDKKKGEFIQNKDGVFTATAPTSTLDEQDKPDSVTLTLDDKAKTPVVIPLGEKQQTVDADKTRHAVRTGSIDGEYKVTDPVTGLSVSQKYTASATATRTWNDSLLSLQVLERDPSNPKEATPVDLGFNEQTHEYTVERPATAINDSFTLGYKIGADATITPVNVTLGGNASRVLAFTLNQGKDTQAEYKVTINFAPADILSDSPAKLTGIYVNKTGEATQGQLVDNWNPNRLDYIVTVGENDPSPYVLPTYDKTKVNVHPGKVTQTADSVKQEWQVVDKASGASRTYSLTVVRQHSWKTAVEEFKPSDPVAQKATVAPDSDSDAELVSHGYVDANGKYVKVAGNDYQIPEGGTFSYEAKTGQSVGVVSQLTTGMTYQYTVTVLPKDMSFPKQHVFNVTYITAKTNYAALTGILVNGKAVEGFDPDKTEYKVPVAKADQWMVSPQYDKLTGMSVDTEKNGADATITVTSGDGLSQRVYKVHVYENPVLAATGVNGAIMGFGALALAIVAAIILGVGKLLRRRENGEDDVADEALGTNLENVSDVENGKDSEN